MKAGQLSIFDTQPKEGPTEQEPELIADPFCDKIMTLLERMNADLEKQNRELREMIDELQQDWTEDEKLQINNPKEYARRQKEQSVIEPEMPKGLTSEAIECLKNSTVEETIVKLPEGQLDRKVYLEVKSRLELIGGKWKGGKVQGFVFTQDPSDLLEQISNGVIRNLKKEYQFFATPDALADELVALADLQENDRMLEPSAGQGAIVNAALRVQPELIIECCELMDTNRSILNKMDNAVVIAEDFLQIEEVGETLGYNKIIANPPFSKNQDIDHIRKMYACLDPGGRIVSIASKHWMLCENKKETDFKNWLDEIGAEVKDIPAGRFKESGTNIATCIIVIDK